MTNYWNLKVWLGFLKQEIDAHHIIPNVMRPNQHWLLHVPYMIRSMGVLPAYSASSMERSIQIYRRRLRSQAHVNKNIGDVLMRTSIDHHISRSNWDMDKKLDLLGPKVYTDKTCYTHSQDNNLQLWTPKSVYYTRQLPCDVSSSPYFSAWANYCFREDCSLFKTITKTQSPQLTFMVDRGFQLSQFKSHFYQNYIQQSKRNDAFFKFVASHMNKQNKSEIHYNVVLLTHITQQIKSSILNKTNISSSVAVKQKSVNNASVDNQDIDMNQPVVLYPRRTDRDKIAITMAADCNASTKTKLAPATSGLSMPVTPHYVAPRAPIVLCHGLYGFDKLGPDALPLLQVQYWGGIENELAKLGAKVIVTKVPSTGSIWDRAHTLHSILKSILDGKDVNFIAHSMGGLDCRYLISHIADRPYKINSLTTISTPHRGSPVMDWFRDNVGVGMAGALAAAIEKINQQKVPPALLSRELKETLVKKQQRSHNLSPSSLSWSLVAEFAKSPTVLKKLIRLVDTEAYANLSTDYCRNYFNPNTPNDPNISYYSYGANASFPAWSLLNMPSKWIKEKEGINDGLVSVESAKWGTYIKTLQADHWDLNGQRWKYTRPFLDRSKFDTIDFYMEMATHLYQQGH
ncbi:hypothetical protein [Parasitella parasitica]|uniref:GPI inositol-deacylase n=1 Tax=Parasitella parasitica TaxID=35722 RepID=A0A0B7NW61_9FUNG|nr:hypothetical protein [Parasitella parasitica]